MNTEKITTNFFSELDKMLNSKNAVVLNILKNSEGEMTIAITNVVTVDDDKETLPAISISGPVAEIDAAFFEHIRKPAEKIKGLTVNTSDAEEAVDKLQETETKEKSAVKSSKKTTKASVKKAEAVEKVDPKKEALKLAAEAHVKFEAKEYSEAVDLYTKAVELNPKDKNIAEGLKKAVQWQKSVEGLYANEPAEKATIEEVVKESPNIHIVQPTPDKVEAIVEDMILEMDLMADDDNELPI